MTPADLIPGRYRSKPMVIEAMLYTEETRDAVIAWCRAGHQATSEEGETVETRKLRIPTLEGVMLADLGDWIVHGTHGEFYPVKPHIFAVKYEPA